MSKVSDDIGSNFAEKLVELVGKHNILYDTTTGFSNFHLQDEIWRKIASDLNEDACKLKWKNIRSCYTRYLRQISSQDCKIKRGYYLAERLKFLLPFCKPNSRQISLERPYSPTDDIGDAIPKSENRIFEFEMITKDEPLDDHDDEETINLELDPLPADPDVDENEDNSEINMNNKRQLSETSECESPKRRLHENNDEAEMAFFTSLLPDIRKMTGKQKNLLKIAILNSIDSILYSEDS